jgi:WD40 repeat protein
MPRPERALHPGDDRVTRFAADLRALRENAGRPGYRALAAVAHYSVTTLSEAAGGRQLPTLAVTLAYVRACGGTVAEWERRWHVLAADLAAPDITSQRAESDDSSAPPYVGLAAFQPADADRFFGREALINDLVDRVGRQRFLAVFGASGAGKSSLLRAGLIARAQEHQQGNTTSVLLMTPGSHPIEECAIVLSTVIDEPAVTLRNAMLSGPDALHLCVRQVMAEQAADADLLLVVDQFEEVFTLCQNEEESTGFIAALLHATRRPDSRLRVVLGIRTDFYTHCARDPDLVAGLRDAQILVGSMSPDELRCAITQPAIQAGCTVESALLAAVMADAVGEPGALPLLSHALLETWRRRRGTTLALSGYQAAGGIAHAVAQTADSTYSRLDPPRQRLAKALFLRLIALGEGTDDTKRRVHRDELDTLAPDVTIVLEELTQARLITLDHDYIEIAHEALIHNWPRLHHWLSADRDGIRIHRQLTDAARAWDTLHRDRDVLYRGVRLASTHDWAQTTDTVLSATEQQFLDASRAAESDRHTAARRRTRRLRVLVAVLSVLLLMAGMTTAYAVHAQQTATRQRDIADAQDVLSQAALLRDTDPALALQLMLAAYHLAPTQQTSSGVLNALYGPIVDQLTGPAISTNQVGVGSVISQDAHLIAIGNKNGDIGIWTLTDSPRASLVATLHGDGSPAEFSPNGHVLATIDRDHVARFWDVTHPAHPTLITALFEQAGSVVFSAQRNLVATSSSYGVHLYSFTDPRRPVLLATLPSTFASIALSRDGRTLAATSGLGSGGMELWDITDPRHPLIAAVINSAAPLLFTPVGSTLAAVTPQGAIQIWDVSNPHHPVSLTDIAADQGPLSGVTFSADGRMMASANESGPDMSISIWDIATPGDPHRVTTVTRRDNAPGDLPPSVHAMVFRSDGNTLATVDSTGAAQLIDLPELSLAAGSTTVLSAAFDPDGHTLVTTDGATTQGQSHVRSLSWDTTNPSRPQQQTAFGARSLDITVSFSFTGANVVHGGYTYPMAFSPRGHLLAIGDPRAGLPLGDIELWDMTNTRHPVLLSTITGDASPVAFSSDGHTLATIGHLWDVTDLRHPKWLSELMPRNTGAVTAMALSPDGRVAATDNAGHTIRLWDITVQEKPKVVGSISAGGSASLTFDPVGHTLAARGSDGTVQLWDVTDPAHPAPLTTLACSPGATDTAVFSPNGHQLAIADADQTTCLWDVQNLTQPTLLVSLTGTVAPLAFGPDGHTLAVVGVDGSVQLRETDVQRAATQICTMATPTITRAEWDRYFPGRTYQPPCS